MVIKAQILLGLGLLQSLPSVMAVSPAMGRPQKPVANPAPQYPPDVPLQKPVIDPMPQYPPEVAPAPPTGPIAPAPQPPTDAPNPLLPLVPTSDSIYTKQASCTADDGKVYLTSEGSAYKLQCSYSGPEVSQVGDSTIQPNFAACMEKCSQNYLCKSVQYNARPGGASPSQGDCTLFKLDSTSTTVNAQYDFAVQIDPPTHDEADSLSQLCSTTCPFADGMPYASSYGETFIMDCGKRHGTKYLSVLDADSLQDCIEVCAGTVSCHSVDYQGKNKKCYLGSHHGNPSILASSFSSARSIGCAGACFSSTSCCSSPLPNRKNITQTLPKGPDTSCSNEGFAYAIYPNQKNGINLLFTAPNYVNFDPTVFKTVVPYFKGTTPKLGITDITKPASIYGQTPKDAGYVTVDHRGYLYAQQDGEYTFYTPTTDDITLFWLGAAAYAGFTRPTASLDQAYVAKGGVPKTFKSRLEKGKYYPLRLMFANGGGAGNFEFKITAPDGSVVIDDKSTRCPDLVQFGCRAEYNAPPFPAWGAES